MLFWYGTLLMLLYADNYFGIIELQCLWVDSLEPVELN